MSEQVFTVFDSSEYGWQDSDEEVGQTVEEIIAWYVSCGDRPVAWCEGSAYGNVQKLRAESIAAGRLIDCVDGKYIPRMPLATRHLSAAEHEAMLAGGCGVDLPAKPSHVSHVEPERAPLDWNKPTPFDPFGPEFVVKRYRHAEDLIPAAHCFTDRTQILAAERDPMFGSASLLVR